MAIQRVNIGTIANDGTGDDLREAFVKVNNNFTELDIRQPEKTTGANLGTAGEGVFANTTSGSWTLTLPAGSIGDEVSFVDYAGTFDSNALTIASNGSEKIIGSTSDLTVSVERAANTLVYTDGTQGWLLKNK